MLIEDLEEHYKLTGDFRLLDQSFKADEIENKCPNIEHSIQNLLQSQTPCVIRWVLYKWKLDSSYEQLLLKLLSHKDEYIHLKSAKILTELYIEEMPPQQYWNWIKHRLAHPTSYAELNQILNFISEILACNVYTLRIKDGKIFDRTSVKLFFANDQALMQHIKSFLYVQELQYQALRIIWILSFNSNCIDALTQYKFVPALISILKEKLREKLVRLSIATFKNLIDNKYQFRISQAFEIIDHCEVSYNDEDIIANAFFVKEKLTQFVKKSSPIDNYLNELFSGTLEDTPYHHNDAFWDVNSSVLIEHKIEIIKALKKYLKSDNTHDICLAANDLYKFLKHSPEITEVVSKHGLREDLFNLTNSENPDIRFHAAQALASTILSDWHE